MLKYLIPVCIIAYVAYQIFASYLPGSQSTHFIVALTFGLPTIVFCVLFLAFFLLPLDKMRL